jgi:hypothetical protein
MLTTDRFAMFYVFNQENHVHGLCGTRKTKRGPVAKFISCHDGGS